MKKFTFVLAGLVSVFATETLADNVSEKQVECLAKNIYHEARGESNDGQYAVAWVTRNRVNSKRYPNTYCKVVKQAVKDSKGNPLRNKCHFSWFCDGKSDKIKNTKAYLKAKEIAVDVVQLDSSYDITDGSIMYHADYVKPYWADSYQLAGVVDTHLFYK